MTLIACTDVLSQSSASIVVPEVKVAKNGLSSKDISPKFLPFPIVFSNAGKTIHV